MSLESVGDLAIHIILSKVGPAGTVSVGCAGKRFREWASDESLWSKFCSDDDLQLAPSHPPPLDPFGNPTPTFKAAYQSWREAFKMYPWPLVLRVKRCWDKLKMWLLANFPEALATLRKGASEDDIDALETSLKVKLPIPTRLLYRFCDGQELMGAKHSRNMLGSPLGLIGGYSFYDNLVNVFLLPLSQVIRATKGMIINQLRFGSSSRSSKFIVMAASSTYCEKIFFLDCESGRVYVGTQNLATDGEMVPCVPNALISSEKDGMLLWLEEHGRRLQNGIIRACNEGKLRSISLFPEKSPLCSTAVTNGVQVCASAVFVPELSDLRDDAEPRKYCFSYSIRMSLLPEGCNIDGKTFNSCQLYWRRWIFRGANDDVIQDFNAEAVIGKYPLLRPGKDEFVYESCSYQQSSSGSMEGSFTFFPGSLTRPQGRQFEAEVARFPLQLPDYIF